MGGEVEEVKSLILREIAENGPLSENTLSVKYRINPEDPSNEIFRAAVASMIREEERGFLRQMLIRVMGKEGGQDQAEFLSALLDSTDKPNFKCNSRARVDYGGMEHAFDSDDRVREAAAEAIREIIARGSNMKGSALVNGGLGKALLRSALLDVSGNVRGIAAEVIWNHADKNVILTLISEMKDAEEKGNLHIYCRAEDALNMASDAMGKARVRGTAIGPLIDAAIEDGKTGMVASDVLVRLAKMEDEVVIWIKKKKASINSGNNLGNDEQARKVRHLTALIDRIGMVCGNEKKRVPRQLAEPPDEKQTRSIRVPVVSREEEGPIQVPGDWIGNWLKRRAYAKEQKRIEKMREMEKRMRVDGKTQKR